MLNSVIAPLDACALVTSLAPRSEQFRSSRAAMLAEVQTPASVLVSYRPHDCRMTVEPQCESTRSVVLPNSISRIGLWP